MTCAENLRVQAYFDGEVDSVAAMEIERHIGQCTECTRLIQHLERTRTAMQQALPYDQAPSHLRERILHALDQETALETPALNKAARPAWAIRPFWIGVLGGTAGTAIAATLLFFLLSPGDRLLDDIVGAQVRSLMPSHLIDVASTDRHTVKPWFAGHTDISPLVADFAQQGYRLIGGRADYLDHQRSAVVVYQHGAHVINVFSWSSKRMLPHSTTRNGYRMAFFKLEDLDYCAVSDAGWDELLGLVRLLQDLGAHDVQQ